MYLSHLARLHASMQEIDISRYLFKFTIGHLRFEALFLDDLTPMVLFFGCIGGTRENIVFSIEVHHDYTITPYISDREMYNRLVNSLRVQDDPQEAYSPRAFFQEFHAQIPERARREQRPSPDQVAHYYRDVPEADKVFFCGWLRHQEGRQPTAENLRKTKMLLGEEAYQTCLHGRVSSCWSDRREDSRPVNKPL